MQNQNVAEKKDIKVKNFQTFHQAKGTYEEKY